MDEQEKATLNARLDEILDQVKRDQSHNHTLVDDQPKKETWHTVGLPVAALGVVLLVLWLMAGNRNASNQEVTNHTPISSQQPVKSDQLEVISNASDDVIRKLIQDCRNSIEVKLRNQTGGFAVYFPNYDADYLRKMFEGASVLNMNMGRPSVAAPDKDATTEIVDTIRKFPKLPIRLAVESASDSFSGAKKWAGIYECRFRGLEITAVDRVNRYFFD